jgi:hypothetical protein
MTDTKTNIVISEVEANRDISVPQEWLDELEFDWFYDYAQLTLVDDKIALHKPIATDVKYERACKIEDGSYIRRLDFNKIRPPDIITRPLGIQIGDKVELTRAENCIEIRKYTEPEPEPITIEPKPDPKLVFCCVCGSLGYTGSWLKKVSAKYICGDCVELVKAL